MSFKTCEEKVLYELECKEKEVEVLAQNAKTLAEECQAKNSIIELQAKELKVYKDYFKTHASIDEGDEGKIWVASDFVYMNHYNEDKAKVFNSLYPLLDELLKEGLDGNNS